LKKSSKKLLMRCAGGEKFFGSFFQKRTSFLPLSLCLRDSMSIRITDRFAIEEFELQESFLQASGPGGQHVNKVATAVQLRFDVRASTTIPEDVKQRLSKIAGRQLTNDGVLVLFARGFRSQERNRRDARERLVAMLRAAAEVPVRRRTTRPTLASKLRRLEAKGVRSAVKAGRRRPDE
jgi:ribosome-associated protein